MKFVILDPKDKERHLMLQQYIEMNLVTGLEHCKVCYKSYEGKHRSVRKRQLFDHIERVHLKLRSYICDYCGHTFNSKAQKASHISLKHREEHKSARFSGKSMPDTPVKVELNTEDDDEPIDIETNDKNPDKNWSGVIFSDFQTLFQNIIFL